MEHLSGPLTAELVELYEDDAMYHFIIALPPDGKPLDQVRVPGRQTVQGATQTVRRGCRVLCRQAERGYMVLSRQSEGGTGC